MEQESTATEYGMFSRQEHHTDDQVICWNCEEAVHQSVIVCPYCNVEVHRKQVQKASEQNKITTISQQSISLPEMIPIGETTESSMQTLSFLCSLFLLLAGSALFLLAVIIAFFARDGVFTISWQEHTWSAFFGLGLSLLAGGAFFMQNISPAVEEA